MRLSSRAVFTQSGDEADRGRPNIRNYELLFFKPEFGGVSEEKKTQLKTRVLHHDPLGRLEDYLFETGLACDVNLQGVLEQT